MIVVGKSGLLFIAFNICGVCETAPSINAGNPTQNPPQEGVSATTGTTGSRTSDINEGSPGVASEEGNNSGIRYIAALQTCKFFVCINDIGLTY